MSSDAIDEPALDAGEAWAWLRATRAALHGEADADVPCGECTACCESGQFVHIAPDEDAALARIPAALLVPAPGLPPGHVVLGYDERGRCPMLGERGCTIYEDRPRTCRTYDCRVFAATEVPVSDPKRAAIATRVARWRFSTRAPDDAAALDAVRRAAASLAMHPDPTVSGPGRALLAIELHELFLAGDPDAGELDVALERATRRTPRR